MTLTLTSRPLRAAALAAALTVAAGCSPHMSNELRIAAELRGVQDRVDRLCETDGGLTVNTPLGSDPIDVVFLFPHGEVIEGYSYPGLFGSRFSYLQQVETRPQELLRGPAPLHDTGSEYALQAISSGRVRTVYLYWDNTGIPDRIWPLLLGRLPERKGFYAAYAVPADSLACQEFNAARNEADGLWSPYFQSLEDGGVCVRAEFRASRSDMVEFSRYTYLRFRSDLAEERIQLTIEQLYSPEDDLVLEYRNYAPFSRGRGCSSEYNPLLARILFSGM
ncbi:MAG: hypothetical protein ACXIVO_01635 [Glycocaulis sp.]